MARFPPWWFREMFTYRTQREMVVDMWEIGLLHRIMQVVVLWWVLNDIFGAGKYAYSETAMGVVNAWAEAPTNWSGVSTAAIDPAYCASATNNYVYKSPKTGSETPYVMPPCQNTGLNFIVTKGIGAVSFTTSIYETESIGWQCDSSEHANKTSECDAIGAAAVVRGVNGIAEQCECSASSSYYPKGVEDLLLAFEHGYQTTADVGSLKSVSNYKQCADGESSSNGECLDHALDTSWTREGDTITAFGGETIEIPLSVVLDMAGYSLDRVNRGTTKDTRAEASNDGFPTFRTTGIRVTADLEYTNRRENEPAPFLAEDVDAKLTVKREDVGWAGTGQQVFVLASAPVSGSAATRYQHITRYRQDVVIVFRASGKVYRFNLLHLMQVLVAGYLFLGIAVNICDFITFNMLPHGVSTVLRNKRGERVSRLGAFAQLGARAAVAVNDFKSLDRDNKGYVDVADLASVFGSVGAVDKQEAIQIAQTIMRHANRADVEEEAGRLSFNEFMSTQQGESLDFDTYTELIKYTGKVHKMSTEDVQRASSMYDAVETGIELDDTSRAPSRSPSSLAAASLAAASPQPAGANSAAAAASVAATAATTPAAPPPSQQILRLTCYSCRRLFGAPPGAQLVACPHCRAPNRTNAAAPPPQPAAPQPAAPQSAAPRTYMRPPFICMTATSPTSMRDLATAGGVEHQERYSRQRRAAAGGFEPPCGSYRL